MSNIERRRYPTRIGPVADEVRRLHDEKDEAQRQEHMAKNEAARLRSQLRGAVDMLERIAADLESELEVGGQIPTVFPDEIRALLARLGER